MIEIVALLLLSQQPLQPFTEGVASYYTVASSSTLTASGEPMRDGALTTFALTTDAREKARYKDEELKAWGMTARDMTRITALQRKRPDQKGVLVGSLRQGGPCTEAKPPIEYDDLILSLDGKPVDDVAALRALTAEVTKDQEDRVPVLVGFERKGLDLLTVVKVGKEPDADEPMLSRKAWLPARTQVLTGDVAEALGLKGKPGVRVTKVFPGHAAEKADMRVGDVLLELDGERIEASQPEDEEVLPTMVRQYKIGTEVTFKGFRDGAPLELTLALESPPTPASELKRYEDEYFEMTVRELSFDDRVEKHLDKDLKGVTIETVEPAGWAALASVRAGDVLREIDGREATDVKTVESILKEAREKKAKRVIFFIKRGIQTMFFELEPDWDDETE